MDDPAYDDVACGSDFFDSQWRFGCQLPCCLVYQKPESDKEWEAERVGVW